MKRLLTYLSIGFVFGFFSWSTNASAQEKKPPVGTEKPAGLRVMSGGHSLVVYDKQNKRTGVTKIAGK